MNKEDKDGRTALIIALTPVDESELAIAQVPRLRKKVVSQPLACILISELISG